MLHRWLWLVLMVVVALPSFADSGVVVAKNGEMILSVSLGSLPATQGTVAYQGPVFEAASPNWKDPRTYVGVLLADVVAAVGGVPSGALVSVIASDGYRKDLPAAVVRGETPAGRPILATGEVGADPAAWSSGAMLVFLSPDGQFSNDDMLASFGAALSHYYSGTTPSTTGLLVKNVAYVIVGYDGGALPAAPPPASTGSSTGQLLTLVQNGVERTFTVTDLTTLDRVSGEGTFTTSAGTDYTSTYVGVPLSTLLGSVPLGATVRVSAADGYQMNYVASQLLDRTAGTWILAYGENGAPLAPDAGPVRVVQVGPDNPHFRSALAVKQVVRIEVLGEYVDYTLTLRGAVTRVLTRAELEAGAGCPCHTASVTATMKGETHTYTGLPLWRLLAYIDDDRFPAPEKGIFYDDGDFSDALARAGYAVTLAASDGYSQTVSSRVVARDDRFLIALKRDGAFLDPTSDGYLRFVYDDSVTPPEGTGLKSVKFLAEIRIGL